MGHLHWEMFMGARLFAWMGGLALFFAIAFFVKYSLDHALVAPWLRITLGLLVSLGLIGAGISLRLKRSDLVSVSLLSIKSILILLVVE